MQITITNRTQIVDASPTRVHKNYATDFSEASWWHISNARWFLDDLTMLNFTVNTANHIQLSKWYAFVKYIRDWRTGWARCEIVNDISETISEWDGTYYLYLLQHCQVLDII